MNVRLIAGASATALVLAAALLVAGVSRSQAQQDLTISVDVDPAGNTATSLGDDNACVSVAGAAGTSFKVDVTAATIPSGTQVSGFNYFLHFDDSRLRVTGKNHGLFLLSAGGDLVDVGDEAPQPSSPFTVAVADLGVDTEETGPLAGTLGRYTFQVKANAPAGLATISLATLALFDEAGQEIPLVGSQDGFVSVGEPCPANLPSRDRAPDGTSTSDGGDGGNGDGNGDGDGGDGDGGDGGDGAAAADTPTAVSTPGAEDGDQTPDAEASPTDGASPTPEGDASGDNPSDDDDDGTSIWLVVLIVLVALALVGGGAAWWWRRQRGGAGT